MGTTAILYRRYRPSNSSEAEDFFSQWCDLCVRGSSDCEIQAQTFWLDVDDPKYPKEWIQDAEGAARCTAFGRKP